MTGGWGGGGRMGSRCYHPNTQYEHRALRGENQESDRPTLPCLHTMAERGPNWRVFIHPSACPSMYPPARPSIRLPVHPANQVSILLLPHALLSHLEDEVQEEGPGEGKGFIHG